MSRTPGLRLMLLGCATSIAATVTFALTARQTLTATSDTAPTWPLSQLAAYGAALGLVLFLAGLYKRWRTGA